VGDGCPGIATVWCVSVNTAQTGKSVIVAGDDRQGESRGAGRGTVLLTERTRPKLQPPKLFRVIMLNDDYTPMDFVVHVLELFFGMAREQATRIMLTVHTEGKAVCGTYSRDVAETKVAQVSHYARQNEHPLMCNLEMVDSGDAGD